MMAIPILADSHPAALEEFSVIEGSYGMEELLSEIIRVSLSSG